MSAPRNKYDNETYLSGIRKGDEVILHDIYEEFYPGVLKYIRSRGGTEQEVEDIFATALEAIFIQAREGSLELDKPFSTYLFAVCKYQWLKIFRKKSRLGEVTESIEKVHIDREVVPDRQLEKKLLQSYIRAAFRKLSKDCRQIIRMRWAGESYEAIRQLMGYRSEGYARKRKHICYQRLQKLVAEDPKIRELYGDPGKKE